MFENQFTQDISMYTVIQLFRRRFIFFCLFLTLIFCGCSKQTQSPDLPVSAVTESAVSPETFSAPTLTPTIKPVTNIVDGEELTAAMAQTILEDKIDTSRFSLSLLSEDIMIGKDHYIAFTASEKSIPLEPVLIVSKSDLTVSCMSSQGKVIPFNRFPENDSSTDISCDWSGRFVQNDEAAHLNSTLLITLNDTTSFEFSISKKNAMQSNSIAGIGHISGNTAIFTDESGHELIFQIDKDTISLYDETESFTRNGISLSGTYLFDTYEFTTEYHLKKEDAIDLLSTLNKSQTKLPAELSEYSLKTDESQVIVKDRICYIVYAYANLEDEPVLMTTFYISVDGNVIFAFDNASDFPYAVIEL